MSEQNKAIGRRWAEEIWNDNDFSAADEYIASDLYFRSSQAPEFTGIATLKEMVAGNHAAFPDGHFTVDEEIAEGDAVVHRWTFRGTHEGEFLGVEGTGKKVELTGTAITHIRDGKIVSHTADVDMLSMLQQIGAA